MIVSANPMIIHEQCIYMVMDFISITTVSVQINSKQLLCHLKITPGIYWSANLTSVKHVFVFYFCLSLNVFMCL